MKKLCLQFLKIMGILILILVVIDLLVTTDRERLVSSLNKFRDAIELHDPLVATEQLDEDFEFYYTASPIDRRSFIKILEQYVELVQRSPLSLQDYLLEIDGKQATGDVVYLLRGRAAVAMKGNLKDGKELHCKFTWAKKDNEWKITRIELLRTSSMPTRLPYLK